MADNKLYDEIAERLRRSALMRRPLDYFVPPTATTNVALSHLHQVEIRPRLLESGPAIVVALELHRFEHGSLNDPVPGLAEPFAAYVNDSRSVSPSGGWGRVTYVRSDGAHWWPQYYVLTPTFGLKQLDDVQAAENRLRFLEKNRDEEPVVLQLLWHKLLDAWENDRFVECAEGVPGSVRFYQPVVNSHGEREMWLGSLPSVGKARPDNKGFITLQPDNGSGSVVRLTTAFVANLVYLLKNAGAAQDGLDFLKSYYMKREPESASSLRLRIELLEQELEEAQERLAELEGTEPSQPGDGEEDE